MKARPEAMEARSGAMACPGAMEARPRAFGEPWEPLEPLGAIQMRITQ
jgi:hypothetical protein